MERLDPQLKGEAMKEDVYRKACMRDGAVWLYDLIVSLAEADLSDASDGGADIE